MLRRLPIHHLHHHLFLLLFTLFIAVESSPISHNIPEGEGDRVLATPPVTRAALCHRPEGIYDVCDTLHSYLRCRGTRPMTAFDCAATMDPAEPDPGHGHYCQILDDRGSCTGRSPPLINGNTQLSLH
ncbi:hypothetical protein F5Y17DRAFT_474346 [Xylariaceae sp. FL0594]|nr:hypothetical protein F5Y17DRAFT_474346 [Xylariaceae sp. FL0594]